MNIVFRNESVIVLGEVNKFVPMSPQRIFSFSLESDDIVIVLSGATGEQVQFSISYLPSKVTVIKCAIGDSGHATLSVANRKCV